MKKADRIIIILGIFLILIAGFKFLNNLVTFLFISKFNLSIIWQQLEMFRTMVFRLPIGFSYIGIENMLNKLYSISPIYKARTIAILISFIKIYLPFLCRLSIFIAGIGFFFRKNIFRIIAIIAISIFLLLEITDSILLLIHPGQFYFDRVLGTIFLLWIIYYLTRLRIKERFKN